LARLADLVQAAGLEISSFGGSPGTFLDDKDNISLAINGSFQFLCVFVVVHVLVFACTHVFACHMPNIFKIPLRLTVQKLWHALSCKFL